MVSSRFNIKHKNNKHKNKIRLTLCNERTGGVVYDKEIFNVASPYCSQNGECGGSGLVSNYYSYRSEFFGDHSTYSKQAIVLLDDTFGVTADEKHCNALKYISTRTTDKFPSTLYSESNTRTVGYCYQNSPSNNGTKGGLFVPSMSYFNRDSSRVLTYEWGTTQANGTFKAVGFFYGARVAPWFNYIFRGRIPELASTEFYYSGFKTVGSDKHIYFVKSDSTSSNVVVLNAGDLSLVATKTLTNPAIGLNLIQGMLCFVNGNAYLIKSASRTTPSITFTKVSESDSMTFSGESTVSYSMPSGWTNSEVWRATSDERYIYILAYKYSVNTECAILKFDTTTDTFVSVTVCPDGFAGAHDNFGASGFFNICPNTGKLFTLTNSNVCFAEAPSINNLSDLKITSSFDSAGYPILTSGYGGTLNFAMENADGDLELLHTFNSTNYSEWYGVFVTMKQSNYYTYSELPTALTKTSSQFLRLQYTLGW